MGRLDFIVVGLKYPHTPPNLWNFDPFDKMLYLVSSDGETTKR